MPLMTASFGNSTGYVNTHSGIIAGCHVLQARSYYRRMELSEILRRIEKRLRATGLSADAASKQAGKPDAIRNIKRAVEGAGREGVSTATLQALAPVLGTTEAWLAAEAGSETGRTTIPVHGKAGAGGVVNSFEEGNAPIGQIDRPSGISENTGAVEITGGSLGKPLDGWYALYEEKQEQISPDMIGSLCIVETSKGRVYIKGLMKGRGNKYSLISSVGRTITGVQIRWVAKVTALVPR